MTDLPEALTAPALAARHGFFTRRGGASSGPYASLNCNLSSGDRPDAVRENRARAAQALGLAPDRLLGLTQVHGADVVTVAAPWAEGAGPRADAAVTDRPGIGLGVITADCAPVLLHDPASGVVGAAHAGWRGAAAGILEATVAAMAALGAVPSRIVAAIGPCIGPYSYEVAMDLRDAVLLAGPSGAERCFRAGNRPDHWLFDLAGYCRLRLHAPGVEQVQTVGVDTLADPTRFFSHRRRTLNNEGPIGHQIAIIALPA